MKPLTQKELNYLADSLSNEDLLAKQCTMAYAHAKTPAVKQFCSSAAQRHQQHYAQLLSVLEQHTSVAPTQTQ